MKQKGTRWALPFDNDADTIGVCVPVPNDPNHRRAFLDALYSLRWSSNWERDPTHLAAQAARRWDEIFDEVAAKLGVEVCSGAGATPCVTYTNRAGFISWYPNHPYYQPDYVAPGYASPAWYESTPASELAYGSFPGDVITTFERLPLTPLIPTIPPQPVWPSFRINFNVGPNGGEVEVRLRNLVLGSKLLITRSDDPLYISGLDVNKDLIEILPETESEITKEFIFTATGLQWLHFVVIPNVDAEETFVTYGAGIKSVTLCGDITPEAEDEDLPLELNIVDDDLVLLYDGIPIDSVPKASLQSWLDKWVDETGDTMTGQLDIDMNSAGGDPTPLRWLRDSVEKLFVKLIAGGTDLIASQGNFRIRNDANLSKRTAVELRNDGKLRLWANTSAGLPPNVQIAFAADGGDAAVGYRNDQAGADLVHWYDHIPILRAAMKASGRLRAVALDAFGYSSTSTWRKQFGLQGGFKSAVDASYKGRVELDVSGYDGDHEVFAAEYGDSILDLPAIAFFGGEPATRGQFGVSNVQDAVALLLNQLNAYHLTDIDMTLAPADEEPELNTQESCNSAWYVANQLSAVISDVLTNLETVSTNELLTGLIDDYGIPANGAYQVWLALVTEFVNASTIAADITDVSDLATQLLSCDFELDCMLTWLDGYGGWAQPTIDVVKAVLSNIWNTAVRNWRAFGALIPSDNCSDLVLACEDVEFDFRWGPPAGADITQGSAPGMGAGLVVGVSGPNWGSWVEFRLQGCTVVNVHVEYETVYVPQWLHITWYEGTEGDWTQQGTVPNGNVSLGAHTWDTGPLFGSNGDTTRILLRMENEATEDAANIIYKIAFELE